MLGGANKVVYALIAFKTQAQNPDADPAVNPQWPWQTAVITSDEQLRELVTAGWSIVANAEYDLYCDRVGTVTTPSFAADKDNVDQTISGGTTMLTASRVLWDKTGVYDATSSKFTPDRDGVVHINGTVTLRDMVGVNSASLDIYRNDEIWFTVSQREVNGQSVAALTMSCDVDGYRSSEHNFDIRVRIEPETATATISGSDEETAWGGSWVAALYQESPT